MTHCLSCIAIVCRLRLTPRQYGKAGSSMKTTCNIRPRAAGYPPDLVPFRRCWGSRRLRPLGAKLGLRAEWSCLRSFWGMPQEMPEVGRGMSTESGGRQRRYPKARTSSADARGTQRARPVRWARFRISPEMSLTAGQSSEAILQDFRRFRFVHWPGAAVREAVLTSAAGRTADLIADAGSMPRLTLLRHAKRAGPSPLSREGKNRELSSGTVGRLA